MLDLTLLETEYYELKLLDGTLLQLKRPTQGMTQYLTNIKNFVDDEEKAIELMYNLFIRILNRNTNSKEYSEEILEDYDSSIIGYVIKDYFQYWNDRTNVVFQNAQ